MRAVAALVFSAAVLWVSCCGNATEVNAAGEKRVIQLLTLLPYFNPVPAKNPSWDGGNDIQPVLDLAKDQINSNPFLLENYTLELVHGRDGCDVVTETPLGFIQKVFTPDSSRFAGIIGPGCSSSTTMLGQVTGRPELDIVLLHGGGSEDIADRERYGHLLGTLGSTEGFVEGFRNLVRKSGWNRVAILYDDSRLYYLSTKRLFVDNLPIGLNLQYLAPVSFTFLPLDIVQGKLLRIVFVMCPLELTQRILCLAKNNSMVYGNNQFVIMSQKRKDLVSPVNFTYERVQYFCSRDDMASIVEKMFLLLYNLMPTEGESIISNITFDDYLEQYQQYRAVYNRRSDVSRNATYSIWATYFYDSVWAWALVLDNLTKSAVPLDLDGTYESTNQTPRIIEQFYLTKFQGISGEISFRRETGFTPREIDIFQINNNVSEHLASVDGNGSLYLISSNTSIDFIPDTFDNATLRENRGLAIFFNVITSLQVFVVVILHVLTIVYRKKPLIKASSPKLLHMSYIGIYIMLIGTYLWSFNPAALISVEKRHIFCQLLWSWCLPIGFTLAFCPVAMRTYRIYRIFKHYLNPGPFISDPFLVGTVLVFLLIDLLISVLWTSLDRYALDTIIVLSQGGEGQLSVINVRRHCYCEYLFVWFAVIFTYKAVILVVVTVFALLTRKIANRSFATTSLRVLVFLLAIVMILGFSLYYISLLFNYNDPNIYFSFTTLCVLLNLVAFLYITCVFVPPLTTIFKTYHRKIMVTVTSNTRLD